MNLVGFFSFFSFVAVVIALLLIIIGHSVVVKALGPEFLGLLNLFSELLEGVGGS